MAEKLPGRRLITPRKASDETRAPQRWQDTFAHSRERAPDWHKCVHKSKESVLDAARERQGAKVSLQDERKAEKIADSTDSRNHALPALLLQSHCRGSHIISDVGG